MTPQSLDAVVALVPCPFCGDSLTDVYVSEGTTFSWRKVDGCCADGPEVRHDTISDDQEEAERVSRQRAIDAWNHRVLTLPPDWHPTPEAINALPQPLRDYIHTIQTSHPSYDNAGEIRRLRERVAELRDRWRTEANFDGYETGILHIDEATANREAATLKCADELDALIKGGLE